MDEHNIIELIKDHAKEFGKVPTISGFASKHNTHASAIIKKFGSWNNLLLKAELKPNKSSKRTSEQLVGWVKSHPNARYSDIPPGIRGALENTFGSIGKARIAADINILDWRHYIQKKSKKNTNAGRPVEYTEEIITDGLRALAVELNRPPKLKDISKKTCGFPQSAIFNRFTSFGEALKKASLPPSYSYHENKKILKEFETIILNIKLSSNNIPEFYNVEIDCMLPTFVYGNTWEIVKLTRSEVCDSSDEIMDYNKKCNDIIVWYLVDDSLFETEKFEMKCAMDLKNKTNEFLYDKLLSLRLKYDEISRKYINFNIDMVKK